MPLMDTRTFMRQEEDKKKKKKTVADTVGELPLQGVGPLSDKEFDKAIKMPERFVKDEPATPPVEPLEQPAEKPAASKNRALSLMNSIDKMFPAIKNQSPELSKTIEAKIAEKKKELAKADNQEMVESIVHGLTKIAAGLYAQHKGIGLNPINLKPRDWESRKNRIERLYDDEIDAARSAIKDNDLERRRAAQERRGYAVRLMIHDLEQQERQLNKAEQKEEKAKSAAEKKADAEQKARVKAWQEAKGMVASGVDNLSDAQRIQLGKKLSYAGMPQKMIKEVTTGDKYFFGLMGGGAAEPEEIYEKLEKVDFEPGTPLSKGAELAKTDKPLLRRQTEDGRVALFDPNTKAFVRYE